MGRDNNKVTAVGMNTVDSLSPLTKEQSFALQTYYYTNGFKKITDTVRTVGIYDNGLIEVNTSVNEVVSKLDSGYNTSLISIDYTTTHSSLSIISNTNNYTRGYVFGFNGYGQ